MKLTKIVCTIGLKTEQREYLSALMDAGMNMMRLNFSHGDFEEHGNRIKTLKELIKEKQKFVAILVDTPGPEIRTKKVSEESVWLEKGTEFVLTPDDIVGDETKVSMTYENLYQDVKIGDTILVNDGMISLIVKNIVNKDVICEVVKPGTLTDKRGINVPGVNINLPGLTEKDKETIVWAAQQGADFVAASFVRNAKVVNQIRDLLAQNGGHNTKIISKIENQEGIDNFEEILEAGDGIMVARGDMGTEIPLYEVPLVQKMMIKRANDEGKIVITATEMLESMINNPRPTRAEVTDIANAVLDGTDAVMLSGETAKHNCKYPVEAVATMASICERVDKEVDGTQFDINPIFEETKKDEFAGFTDAIAKGAVETAKSLKAKLIVAVSTSGRTARKLRKYFPSQPILVLTPYEQTARQVALVRGAIGKIIPDFSDFESLYEFVKETSIQNEFVEKGDLVVLTCSASTQGEGKTDMMKILEI